MSKYAPQYYTVKGRRMTSGNIVIEYGVSVDELLAMHPGETQSFYQGTTEVKVTRL